MIPNLPDVNDCKHRHLHGLVGSFERKLALGWSGSDVPPLSRTRASWLTRISKIGMALRLVNDKVDIYVRNMPGPKKQYDAQVLVRCESELKQAVIRYAKQEGISTNEAIRRAIRDLTCHVEPSQE